VNEIDDVYCYTQTDVDELRRALEEETKHADRYSKLYVDETAKVEALQEKLRAAEAQRDALADRLVKMGVDRTVLEYWDDLKALGASQEGGGNA
jgi:predicted nuclease with TOPRIM domain